MFGVTRFKAYLMDHHFTLITDHQPLLALFKENKDTPSHASGRIQRWALALPSFEYMFTARSTTAHGNVDALSRFPLLKSIEIPSVPPELILTLEQIAEYSTGLAKTLFRSRIEAILVT